MGKVILGLKGFDSIPSAFFTVFCSSSFFAYSPVQCLNLWHKHKLNHINDKWLKSFSFDILSTSFHLVSYTALRAACSFLRRELTIFKTKTTDSLLKHSENSLYYTLQLGNEIVITMRGKWHEWQFFPYKNLYPVHNSCP